MGLDHISQVVQKEVREGYLGTNQGLVVSMAICNLHAMAEGARLTLLLGGCHFVVFSGKIDTFFWLFYELPRFKLIQCTWSSFWSDESADKLSFFRGDSWVNPQGHVNDVCSCEPNQDPTQTETTSLLTVSPETLIRFHHPKLPTWKECKASVYSQLISSLVFNLSNPKNPTLHVLNLQVALPWVSVGTALSSIPWTVRPCEDETFCHENWFGCCSRKEEVNNTQKMIGINDGP